jgi:hypothetical protein
VRLPRFPSCEGRVAWTLIDGTCVLWSARFWTSRSRTSVSSCHVSSFDSRVMWFTLLHGLNISQNNLKVEACTTYHCSLACVAHHRTPQRRTPPTFLDPPFTTHNFTSQLDQLWTRQLKIRKRVKEEKSMDTGTQPGSLELLSPLSKEKTLKRKYKLRQILKDLLRL